MPYVLAYLAIHWNQIRDFDISDDFNDDCDADILLADAEVRKRCKSRDKPPIPNFAFSENFPSHRRF